MKNFVRLLNTSTALNSPYLTSQTMNSLRNLFQKSCIRLAL